MTLPSDITQMSVTNKSHSEVHPFSGPNKRTYLAYHVIFLIYKSNISHKLILAPIMDSQDYSVLSLVCMFAGNSPRG